MNKTITQRSFGDRFLKLSTVILLSILLVYAFFGLVELSAQSAAAAPIPPPEGYPKFTISQMVVTPTLANTSGVTLTYFIKIINTGAYSATGVSLTNHLPVSVTYNNDAAASVLPSPTFISNTLTWLGDVGFDSSVVISYSVLLNPGYSGTITNSAVISHSSLSTPILLEAETVVTDQPIFAIKKTASPALPGADKPLTYWIEVMNQGQDAVNLPITVTDHVPLSTTNPIPGLDGVTDGQTITWTRAVTLDLGESSLFTFTVQVGSVPSGTVLTNDLYQIDSPVTPVSSGDPYTTTIVDPILSLSKETNPDPPGSNRDLTYILTVYNEGSLATNLVITDRVPASVTYQSGGTLYSTPDGDVVSWTLPTLDSFQAAQVSYTVYISDFFDVPLLNEHYGVCSGEGPCASGAVISNVVGGPNFVVEAYVDPIAKKPGGKDTTSVTPTLVLRNIGPGNALDPTVLLKFIRISVSQPDVIKVIPSIGSIPLSDGPDCGSKCYPYVWTVPTFSVGDVVTFTTIEGQSTIGGDEGTVYSATLIVSDTLANKNTEPISRTATGKVTHLANLIPTKTGPDVIGRGQLMTYTINVVNTALSTDVPPAPSLTETLPLSVSLVSISDNGISQTVGDRTVISWTLPALSPGESTQRQFSVRVDSDLISGTLLINDDYRASWFELEDNKIFSNTGEAMTTTVVEVGLIDSFKTVTPKLAHPGPDNYLTYTLHIVNSSPITIENAKVYDWLPWEDTTYLRDAVASAGTVVSDIVSVEWEGDIGPLAERLITLTVKVDPYFEGTITNTAVITHPDLLAPVVIDAVAYITDKPVLQINKTATPDPAKPDTPLVYTVRVKNLGQPATKLVVKDKIPNSTTYIQGSASGNPTLTAGELTWQSPTLGSAEERIYTFQVSVGNTLKITNQTYSVTCAEGVSAVGEPVVTKVKFSGGAVFLPIIRR